LIRLNAVLILLTDSLQFSYTKEAMHTILQRLKKLPRNQLFLIIILLILLPLIITQAKTTQNSRQLAQGTGEKPNIIVIMTDDQRFETLEAMPIFKERVRSRGITFTNGYVSTSLCCPSRSAFYSGLYAHNTNVWQNSGYSTFKSRENNTIAVWMKNAGYKTALIGKYMNDYNTASYVPPGWDRWYAMTGNQTYNNQSVSDDGKPANSNGYTTDVYREKAIQFIQSTQNPFFLVLTPNAPHNPATPAQRHAGSCNSIPPIGETSQNELQQQVCTLKAVDEAIGAIVDSLGSRSENTVIMYYSDNGYSWGEHGITKKNCLYDQCAKSPFVISYPKYTMTALTVDQPVSHIDLPATIADLGGATPSGEINGVSLKPIIMDPTNEVQGGILIEVERGGKQFGIRTKQYKYWEEGATKRLYDMTLDPGELTNLANKPEVKSIQDDLTQKLALLKENKHVPPDGGSTTSPSPSENNEPTTTISATPSSDPSPGDEDEPTTTPNSTPGFSPSPSEEDNEPTSTPGNTTGTPSPTGELSETVLSLTVFLHGIGNSGDSTNPSNSSLSNKDPNNPQREITVEVLDADNQNIAISDGNIIYNATEGNFTGSISLPPLSGSHTVTVKSNGYLLHRTPRTVSFETGEKVSLPPITLITGDVMSDNELNILDYNALINCFDTGDDDDCIGMGDLNDDSVINVFDVNLWLRELSQNHNSTDGV
jgi:N-acetylglucosamine-6-sulfatase